MNKRNTLHFYKKSNFTLLIIVFSLSFSILHAQNVADLVISEVMVDGDSCIVNDYGNHCGWVEIYNASQGTVNYGGCYFSNNREDLTKCPISRLDKHTSIQPQQLVLFYETCGTDVPRQTFYLNFKLQKGETLYLVSNDGRSIIDSINIPNTLPYGQSICKYAHDTKGLIFDDVHAAVPTPLIYNNQANKKSKTDAILERDPHGWTLTMICVCVVFTALFILFLVYNLSGQFFSGQLKRRREKHRLKWHANKEVAAAIAMALQNHNYNEVEAAIALALYQYNHEIPHENESGIITIKHYATAWTGRQA